MKKFLTKARSTFQDPSTSSAQKPIPQHSQPSIITPPTSTDLLRYRYHHGTNLGSIFVLERWLSGSMFPSSSPGGSELDAVSTSLKSAGLDATRRKFEEHWANAVSDQDFEWLVKEARCTSIRLPIGYFTLGPEWCVGTPFEGVKEVYVNSWTAVKNFINRARGSGIGVLIDFHALPGGANGEEHSGTHSGKAELWGNRRNLDAARKALGFIAREVHGAPMEGVVGIQIVNEAVWDAKGMYDWYKNVIREIGSVNESIPVYVSDGWDLGRALEWTNKRHAFAKGPRNPVVVDTHRYYTFGDADRSQSPHQIIGRIPGELSELDAKEGSLSDGGEAQIIVGEWSCVLDGQTWGRVRPEEKDGLVHQFAHGQAQKWQQRAGGSYFWTYKMDWMDGGEWGFAEQTKKGNVVPPPFLTLPAQDVRSRTQAAQGRRGELATSAQQSHEEYWNGTVPGKKFEHHLYSEGWETGFSDAQKFFTMRTDGALGEKVSGEGGDKIGCMDIWVKKRLLESGQRGEFVWEWEQGFRAGVGAFYQCVGI
jgi:aryl-phospho-beta-D-glucosidase BglC (GH1 family)